MIALIKPIFFLCLDLGYKIVIVDEMSSIYSVLFYNLYLISLKVFQQNKGYDSIVLDLLVSIRKIVLINSHCSQLCKYVRK